MFLKRICTLFIVLLISMPINVMLQSADKSILNASAENPDDKIAVDDKQNTPSKAVDTTPDYYNFLELYTHAEQPIVSLSAEPTPSADTVGVEYGASLKGKNNVIIFKDNESEAFWNVNVGTAGLYNIHMEYILQMENTYNASFDLFVNGEVQHSSMQMLNFPRRFKNSSNIGRDSRGNDVRSSKVEIKEWESWLVDDPDVETNGAILVYLKQGINSLKIKVALGGTAISGLEVCNAEALPVYSDYRKQKDLLPDNAGKEYFWVRQAEDCGHSSDSVLYPTYDRSSAATLPNDPAKLRLNTIGQSSWNTPGQWIEWEIDVPSDGYYKIGMRVRQNELRGFFSTRTVSIDGEVFFEELNGVQFPYDLNWYVVTLGDKENNEYLFYLTEGSHTLRMEATHGAVAESIAELNELTLELNTIYRNIIMITGMFIDPYRDYMLEQQIPDLKKRLIDIRNRLNVQMKLLASLGVRGGSDAVVIDKLIFQLRNFIDKPESIPACADDFLSNISSMSAWALSMKNQPLEIDYIYVKSPSMPEPKAGVSLWTQFWFRTRALLSSFVEDYYSISGAENKTDASENISAWVALGRDQGQVIKDLSDNYFTPTTNITVNLSIMQTGLNEAIAAGRGPDVVLFTGDVVNLASRGVLEDISEYKDFSQISSRFCDKALTPYTYKNGVYGVPLEQNVQMLFYRTDIFEELGLSAPATWDEFDRVLTTLQKNRLSAGLFAGSSVAGDTSIFELLLYQMGGSLFNEDLSAMSLDSEKCYKAFKHWTDFYVKYSLLTEFNFFNRFRSGEMPLGIQAQSMYSTLRLAAPELDGLWEMVPVPQTVLEDGSVSNVCIGNVSPAIVLKNDHKDACFRYLDWFTSTETQVSYGQEVENILGLGARYNPANMEAVTKLNWTAEESGLLVSQIEKSYITPAIPASYYVGRNLTNAFRKVVIRGYAPRESLLIYNKIINSEITRKNRELARRDARSK